MWAVHARASASRRTRLAGGVTAGLVTVVVLTTAACSSSASGKHTSSSPSSPSTATTSSTSGTAAAAPAVGSSRTVSSPAASHSAASGGQSSGQGGGINQIVPSAARKTKAPVPLAGTADFGTGVTAHLTSVTAVQAQAAGPGEVAGPALKVAVRLTNDSDAAISLVGVVVTIADANGTPGVQMSQSGSSPFRGSLAAHASADAVYVFTIPAGHRNPVTVNLSYSSEAPVVLFVGDAN